MRGALTNLKLLTAIYTLQAWNGFMRHVVLRALRAFNAWLQKRNEVKCGIR